MGALVADAKNCRSLGSARDDKRVGGVFMRDQLVAEKVADRMTLIVAWRPFSH
jgi:hypothetical protein